MTAALLTTQPWSAAPALLVVLLVVVLVAREVHRTRPAGGTDQATHRLTRAVQLLAPAALVLLTARLLALA